MEKEMFDEIFDELSIVVVANHHRKPLIVSYLENFVPFSISYTKDYELSEDFTPWPQYKELVQHRKGHIGQHRCLEGHKDALRLAENDNILVLEDDAVPINTNWLEIVKKSMKLLDDFEIVSIHSREPNYNIYKKKIIDRKLNIVCYSPKDNVTPRRALGTLAYLIRKENIPRLESHNYNGLPIDLFLCNCFTFCFIEKSPFMHDRSQGSLIDH
jgi:hypothetical protein